MSKAEQFIRENTKDCSNKSLSKGKYYSWLTPDQALKAVEIAKEEVKEELLEGIKTKAFQYIKEHIKHCSNISRNNIQYGSIEYTQPWLTPTEARNAVEIAREELIEKMCEWLMLNADDYIVDGVEEHSSAMRHDFIDDLRKAMKDG